VPIGSKGGRKRKFFSMDLTARTVPVSAPMEKLCTTPVRFRGDLVVQYDPATGTPSDKKLFHSFTDQPGLPDGSVIDEEGFLWNAQWAGSRIVRFRPDGRVDRVVELPVKNITCLCFGGEDLDTLFITTARMLLSQQELEHNPGSGGVFALKRELRA
jgi:sugar lactone lactonase YvrE